MNTGIRQIQQIQTPFHTEPLPQNQSGQSNKTSSIEIHDAVKISSNRLNQPALSYSNTKKIIEENTAVSKENVFDQLGIIGIELDENIKLLKDTERGTSAANNELQDASRSLSFANYPVRIAERDDTVKNVSAEGVEIEHFIASAKKHLKTGKSADTAVQNKILLLKENTSSIAKRLRLTEKSLMKKREITASMLIGKAAEILEDSKSNLSQGGKEVLLSKIDKKDGLGQLKFADGYIENIKSDREGKDVSEDGKGLVMLIDMCQWNIRDAEKGIRNSQSLLGRTGMAMEDAKKCIRSARKILLSQNQQDFISNKD